MKQGTGPSNRVVVGTAVGVLTIVAGITLFDRPTELQATRRVSTTAPSTERRAARPTTPRDAATPARSIETIDDLHGYLDTLIRRGRPLDGTDRRALALRATADYLDLPAADRERFAADVEAVLTDVASAERRRRAEAKRALRSNQAPARLRAALARYGAELRSAKRRLEPHLDARDRHERFRTHLGIWVERLALL